MKLQDIWNSSKLARLGRLTDELQQSRTPEATLQALQRGFGEEDGLYSTALLSTRGLGSGQYRIVRMQLTKDSASPPEPSKAAEQGHLKIRCSAPANERRDMSAFLRHRV